MEDDPNVDYWKTRPCTSASWPYSDTLELFEARRAIGQLVRTYKAGIVHDLDLTTIDPVLPYIRAAHLLEAAIGIAREELVAEARSNGVAWETIGRTLGVGKQAAHNRFGDGLPAGHRMRLSTDTLVARFAEKAIQPHALPEQIALDLAGTTPFERLEYLVNHAVQSLSEIDELLAQADAAPDAALQNMQSACRRIERVLMTVSVDQAMWEAMRDWSGSPESFEQTNYHAPATYQLYAMHLLISALLFAPGRSPASFEDAHRFLTETKRIYATVMLLLQRSDVESAIPWSEDQSEGSTG